MKKTIKVLAVFLLSVQISCNNRGTNSAPVSAEKIKIENEGVNIVYDDTKIGDTTLLFVHGWGINKSYWSNQADYFSQQYRVVTLDLPGFGESGKNRASWTVEDYAKDISTVLTKLDLKNVILIGHSMSGVIVLETALTNPSRVIGLVGVDNFKTFGVVETPESKEQTANAYKEIRANFKVTISDYANRAMFSPSTDSAIRKRVLHDLTSGDTIIATDCLEQGDKYPADAKLLSYKKTLYLINSDFIQNDTAALKKNNIDYYLLNIGTTGHYPMIEKPDDFNSLLQQAIEKMNQ